jgi:L-ascorbate metabolism protein UlaG (beta-lactamase superfamily)
MEIRFLGHAAFEITDGDSRILIDPFLAPDNPAAAVGTDEVEPTHILLTHGHSDHTAHAVAVAKRTGAKCVAIVESAQWPERFKADVEASSQTSSEVVILKPGESYSP